MWAACCLTFFGFLHCNEFTVPSQASYDPTMHLSYSDISVNKCDNPSVVVVYIKRSKTKFFCRGTSITLGATHDALYPVKAIIPYLARWGSQAGLFSSVRTIITWHNQSSNLTWRSCYKTSAWTLHATILIASELEQPHQQRQLDLQNPKSKLWVDGEVMHTAASYIKPMHSQLATLSKLLIAQGKQSNSKTS